MIHLSPNQTKGLHAEMWVHKQLTDRGYDVTIPPDFQREHCDLLINDRTPVEVKWSSQLVRRRSKSDGTFYEYPKWCWKVSSVPALDGILILIAEDYHRVKWPFIMPFSIMADREYFEINSHPVAYRGLLREFRNNWDVVSFISGQEYKNPDQMDLFHLSLDGKIEYKPLEAIAC